MSDFGLRNAEREHAGNPTAESKKTLAVARCRAGDHDYTNWSRIGGDGVRQLQRRVCFECSNYDHRTLLVERATEGKGRAGTLTLNALELDPEPPAMAQFRVWCRSDGLFFMDETGEVKRIV